MTIRTYNPREEQTTKLYKEKIETKMNKIKETIINMGETDTWKIVKEIIIKTENKVHGCIKIDKTENKLVGGTRKSKLRLR